MEFFPRNVNWFIGCVVSIIMEVRRLNVNDHDTSFFFVTRLVTKLCQQKQNIAELSY